MSTSQNQFSTRSGEWGRVGAGPHHMAPLPSEGFTSRRGPSWSSSRCSTGTPTTRTLSSITTPTPTCPWSERYPTCSGTRRPRPSPPRMGARTERASLLPRLRRVLPGHGAVARRHVLIRRTGGVRRHPELRHRRGDDLHLRDRHVRDARCNYASLVRASEKDASRPRGKQASTGYRLRVGPRSSADGGVPGFGRSAWRHEDGGCAIAGQRGDAGLV